MAIPSITYPKNRSSENSDFPNKKRAVKFSNFSQQNRDLTFLCSTDGSILNRINDFLLKDRKGNTSFKNFKNISETNNHNYDMLLERRIEYFTLTLDSLKNATECAELFNSQFGPFEKENKVCKENFLLTKIENLNQKYINKSLENKLDVLRNAILIKSVVDNTLILKKIERGIEFKYSPSQLLHRWALPFSLLNTNRQNPHNAIKNNENLSKLFFSPSDAFFKSRNISAGDLNNFSNLYPVLLKGNLLTENSFQDDTPIDINSQALRESLKKAIAPIFHNQMYINAKNYFSTSTLSQILLSPNSDIFKILMEKELINRKDLLLQDSQKDFPLLYVFANHNAEIIKTLINKNLIKKADLKIPSSTGLTPLHVICKNINPEIIQFVLETLKPAIDDLKISDNFGSSPTSLAFDNPNPEIFKTLLDNNIIEINDLTIVDKNGHIPIHAICANSRSSEILKALLDNNIIETDDLKIEDESGHTPIHAACRNLSAEVIKMLIENKFINKDDLKKTTNKGNTPVHYACANGVFEIIKVLLENKFIDDDILKITNTDAITPIYHTYVNFKPDHLLIFIDYGFVTKNDLFLPLDHHHTTPLHIIFKNKNIVMLNSILQRDLLEPNDIITLNTKYKGCFLDIRYGFLEYAFKNGDTDLIQTLIDKNFFTRDNLLNHRKYFSADAHTNPETLVTLIKSHIVDQKDAVFKKIFKHNCLYEACLKVDPALLNALLDKDLVSNIDLLHSLPCACQNPNEEIIQALLDKNLVTQHALSNTHKSGKTSSSLAFYNPNENVFLALLNANLLTEDDNFTLTNGYRDIFFEAVKNTKPRILKALFNKGLASKEIFKSRDKETHITLIETALKNRNQVMIRTLKECCDEQGFSLFHFAITYYSMVENGVRVLAENHLVGKTELLTPYKEDGTLPIHSLFRSDGSEYNIWASTIHELIQNEIIDEPMLILGDDKGLTPLHYVFSNNEPRIIKDLIDNCFISQKTLSTTTDNDGLTLLHYLCLFGNGAVINAVFKLGFIKKEILQTSNHYGLTPFHCICLNQDISAFKNLQNLCFITEEDLLQNQDNNGVAPIHYACLNKSSELIQHLVRTKMINKEILKSHHLLQYAAANKNGNIPAVFTNKKSWLSQQDLDNMNSRDLNLLIMKNLDQYPEIIKSLINIGNEPQKLDLFTASQTNSIPLFNALVKNNIANTANLKKVNEKGNTPLHIAFGQESLKMANTLFSKINTQEKKKILETQNNEGNTPFHVMFSNNGSKPMKNFSSITPFIEKNLFSHETLKIQNNNGDTLFHLACMNANTVFIKHMLNQEGLVTKDVVEMQNENGDNSLHLLCRDLNKNVIQLFLDKGGLISKDLLEKTNTDGNTPLDIVSSNLDADLNWKIATIFRNAGLIKLAAK